MDIEALSGLVVTPKFSLPNTTRSVANIDLFVQIVIATLEHIDPWAGVKWRRQLNKPINLM